MANGRPWTALARCSAATGSAWSAVSRLHLRDLRAKGATHTYRADRGSIRKIHVLLGHKSVQTTEIYLKGLVSEIMRPNEVPITWRR